ncbi:MAG: hypothetical protein KF901_26815 [Myxococcales bacterium]|nr:hypothetical protein [Myxococcales bacterium]
MPRGQIPAEVLEVCARLRERGHRAWIVGGCVRDLLRGLDVNDWDICTSAKPEETRRAFKKVIPTGIAHGTVTVLWKGHAFEVTTLRGEGAYSDGRRPDEVFFVDDIREDLARRDFTVNAIAYDPVSETVEDPFGGQADLDAGLLRAVGVPAERFAEDGLRILRGARFVATLEMTLEPSTLDAFAGALDTYAKVSRERIREEWLKAFKARLPSRAFRVMRDTGILARTCPLLDALVGVDHDGADAFEVALAAVDLAAGPMPRLAALLHAVGRARDPGPHYGAVSADLLEGWMRDYRFSNDERRLVTHLVRHHRLLRAPSAPAPRGGAPEANFDGTAPLADVWGDWRAWTDVDVRRLLQRVDPSHAPELFALTRVVLLGQGASVDGLDALVARVEAQMRARPPLRVRDLAINGQDVMAALGGGGRAVGEILEQALDAVVLDPARNEREALLALVGELAAARRAP